MSCVDNQLATSSLGASRAFAARLRYAHCDAVNERLTSPLNSLIPKVLPDRFRNLCFTARHERQIRIAETRE